MMKRRLKAALLGAVVVALATDAMAASLKPSATKDGRVVILISGEIAEGDSDAFKAAVKVANDAGKLVSSIRLNSPGGNLYEGAKLAEAVRFGKMATNVGQGAICASACFLIFAAGETKFANYTAQIGVHGASDEKGTETVQSGAATVSMATAVSISAKQNGGKARFLRGCQPEVALCYNVVSYLDKNGVETALKVIKDMNDKVVAKEVCTFNDTKDIRRCFDWDSQNVHRDMQDTQGNWKKIADE